MYKEVVLGPLSPDQVLDIINQAVSAAQSGESLGLQDAALVFSAMQHLEQLIDDYKLTLIPVSAHAEVTEQEEEANQE